MTGNRIPAYIDRKVYQAVAEKEVIDRAIDWIRAGFEGIEQMELINAIQALMELRREEGE